MDDQILISYDNQQDYVVLAYVPLENFKEVLHTDGASLKLKCRYAGYIINDEDFLIPADIKFEQCYVQL